MADVITETKTTGFLTRLINSILGVIFGIGLFFGSFAILFWNEGRPSNYDVYKKAVEVSSDVLEGVNNGKLVFTKGTIHTPEPLGDSLYLKPGDYAVISRKVEMYSWKEEKETASHTNTGGSETTTTTYSYSKEWTTSPQSSASFKEQTGHTNPKQLVQGLTSFAPNATVGSFALDLPTIQLPELKKLDLSINTNISFPLYIAGTKPASTEVSNLVATQDSETLIGRDYIFRGKGAYEDPMVGDIRISYSVLPVGTEVTVFGKQEDTTRLEPFVANNGVKVFRMFTVGRDEALAKVKMEDTTTSWILRGAGFLMMWFGLLLIWGPLTTVSDILPFLGKVTGLILGIVTFGIALVLSAITIIVSMILQSIIALIIIAVIVLGLIGWMWSKRPKMQQAF